MSYSNTPNTGDTLGSTKVPINTNFSLIQAAMSQDHNGMGTGAGVAGKHNVIHLVEQATEGQTNATEAALYTKTGGNGDLYTRSPNHVDPLPAGEYRMTAFNDANIATFGGNVATGLDFHGWTFLPGGLLLQYGRVSLISTATRTITFPVAFFAATPPYSITLSPNNGTSAYITSNVVSPTNTTFEIIVTSTTLSGQARWMAIGKAP